MFGVSKDQADEDVELFLQMHGIQSWDDDGYNLAKSYYVDGEIEGGHEAVIWGNADEYWRDGKEMADKYRMHVKLVSDLSRKEFGPGILGGGQFHENHIEVALNLEPYQVRDIVRELRHSSQRKVAVQGYTTRDRFFHVTSFGLSGPQDE